MEIASLAGGSSDDDEFAFDDGSNAPRQPHPDSRAMSPAGASLDLPPAPPSVLILADANEALASIGEAYRARAQEDDAAGGGASALAERATDDLGTVKEDCEEEEEEEEEEERADSDADGTDDPSTAGASVAVDWDAVSRQRELRPDPRASARASAWITYADAERHFRADVLEMRRRYCAHLVVSNLALGRFSWAERARFKCLPATRPLVRFGAAEGRWEGTDELELVFLIAKTPLLVDGALPAAHHAMMQSIWKLLGGGAADGGAGGASLGPSRRSVEEAARGAECARTGSHWTSIGFQGSDPSTDLRAAGMLAPLLMLRFASNSATRARALAIVAASRDDARSFPMMAAGIRWTVAALRTLRGGRLAAACNRDRDVFAHVHSLYAAMWKEFATQWRVKRLTIVDFEPLAERIEARCTRAPLRFVDEAGSIGSSVR